MPKRLVSGNLFVIDFDPKCPCGNHATHLATMHNLDYCTPDQETRTEFKCNACLMTMYALAGQLMQEQENFCSSCYLPFDNLCDIIVSLMPIPKEGSGA